MTYSTSVASLGGAALLSCQFEETAVEETVVAEGFLCGTVYRNTTESSFVYTKSGRDPDLRIQNLWRLWVHLSTPASRVGLKAVFPRRALTPCTG
jgi:hypothetical protein